MAAAPNGDRSATAMAAFVDVMASTVAKMRSSFEQTEKTLITMMEATQASVARASETMDMAIRQCITPTMAVQQRCSQPTLRLQLAHRGKAPVQAVRLAFAAVDSSGESVASDVSGLPQEPFSLAPGEARVWTVTLKPEAAATVTATLSVSFVSPVTAATVCNSCSASVGLLDQCTVTAAGGTEACSEQQKTDRVVGSAEAFRTAAQLLPTEGISSCASYNFKLDNACSLLVRVVSVDHQQQTVTLDIARRSDSDGSSSGKVSALAAELISHLTATAGTSPAAATTAQPCSSSNGNNDCKRIKLESV
eukprot:m.41348 g.41348  ORF g.41348 m.41348 type:complete len:307 (-) comp11994_c1_seq1:209-1129(-)